MANPSISSVTIDGNKFNALSVHFGMGTEHEYNGMPMMGSLRTTIEVAVDMHDNVNMPFATLKSLFDMANLVTRDKIKDIKIQFWQDDSQQDALCTYSFRGWINNFATSSGGGGSNHTLTLSLQPTLDAKQFMDIQIGN